MSADPREGLSDIEAFVPPSSYGSLSERTGLPVIVTPGLVTGASIDEIMVYSDEVTNDGTCEKPLPRSGLPVTFRVEKTLSHSFRVAAYARRILDAQMNYTSATNNKNSTIGGKRKYDDPPPSGRNRPIRFSSGSPISLDSGAHVPLSYNNVPPPTDEITMYKRRAQETVARLIAAAEVSLVVDSMLRKLSLITMKARDMM
ncbi:hypothetical protein ACFE04_028390 [Oxalis oulophora]